MRVERVLRLAIGIIVARPENYDTIGHLHEEIWLPHELAKWDGTKEFNADEVPWTADPKERQITGWGKAARVVPGAIKHLSKYRQGTIVLFINCFACILALLILKNGKSEQIRNDIRKLKKNCQSNLHIFLSITGSMNAEIWAESLNLFKNATARVRGCHNSNGTDWKNAIVLNIDNCSSHLESKIAEKYSTDYGIHLRCLTRNASHIQQPVDQNIGKIFKIIFKKLLLDMMFKLDNLANLGRAPKVDTKKWRELVIRLMDQSLIEINSPYYAYLFMCAWINYGLYLCLLGTQDGEESSLHQSTLLSYMRSHNEADKKATKNKHMKEMLAKVLIRKRAPGKFRIKRPTHAINIKYSMAEANRNSRVPQKQNSKRFESLQLQLCNVNDSHIRPITEFFEQDISDSILEFPKQPQYIRAYDAICLQSIYSEHCKDVNKQRELCTVHLGIPFINEQGKLISMPLSSNI